MPSLYANGRPRVRGACRPVATTWLAIDSPQIAKPGETGHTGSSVPPAFSIATTPRAEHAMRPTLSLLIACLPGLVLGLMPCRAPHAEPALVLNSTFTAPLVSAAHDGALDLLYTALFQRLGRQVRIEQLAAERVAGLEQAYPNLVRVAEPVLRYQMMVFSRDAHFAVDGVASLRPYDVGIVNGWKILERTITGTHALLKLEDGRHLFSMLDKGRIDVAVIEKQQGLQLIRSLGLRGIETEQPPLLEGDWFIYLNKKHAALAPLLAAELRG